MLYSELGSVTTRSEITTVQALVLPYLEVIPPGLFKSAYESNTNILAVILPNLIEVQGASGENSNNGGLQYAFRYCSNLTKVDFSSLESVAGSDAMQDTFRGCTSLTSISFPKLKTITGVDGMYELCYGNTNLTEVEFSSLELADGAGPLALAFAGTGITNIEFPKLRTLQNTTVNYPNSTIFGAAFYNCTALETVSFPALETVYSRAFGTTTSGDGASDGMFSSTPNLREVHFPENMESTITAMTGYSNAWGHGSNNIVKFDL